MLLAAQVPDIPPWLLVVVGILLLVKGADWLVTGAVAVAERVGISTLMIGLTIVAAGTSAPELAVNIAAALDDNTDLSFGNVIGSNIANIGLVIGVCALVSPIHVNSRVLTKEFPWLLTISVFGVLLVWLPLTRISPGEALGFNRIDGLTLVGVFLAFGYFWFRLAQRDTQDPLAREAREQIDKSAQIGRARSWTMLVTGLLGLAAGGKLTEIGAVGVARSFGVSDTLIGLTVVAVATSLPEVVTTVAAALRKQADLAVGNVVGSNIFNLLLVLGTTATISPVALPPHGWEDLGLMLALTVALWIISATNNRRVTRIEGAVLLITWACYVVWSVVREKGGL